MSKRKVVETLTKLEAAISRLEEVVHQSRDHKYIQEATIQVFEFTFELFWKTLRRILIYKGVDVFAGPNDVLRTAFQNGLIDNDLQWSELHDLRNQTAHAYITENVIYDIDASIVHYTPVFRDSYNKLRMRVPELFEQNS